MAKLQGSKVASGQIALDELRPDFTSIELIHVNVASNAQRWYRISWEPTVEGWAVVRRYGRIGRPKQTLPPLVFDSLDEAWPTIRAILRKRLRHGYSIRTIFDNEKEPNLPQSGVSTWFEPPSMSREEIDAYEQLALVPTGHHQADRKAEEEADGDQNSQGEQNGVHYETSLNLFPRGPDSPLGLRASSPARAG